MRRAEYPGEKVLRHYTELRSQFVRAKRTAVEAVAAAAVSAVEVQYPWVKELYERQSR